MTARSFSWRKPTPKPKVRERESRIYNLQLFHSDSLAAIRFPRVQLIHTDRRRSCWLFAVRNKKMNFIMILAYTLFFIPRQTNTDNFPIMTVIFTTTWNTQKWYAIRNRRHFCAACSHGLQRLTSSSTQPTRTNRIDSISSAIVVYLSWKFPVQTIRLNRDSWFIQQPTRNQIWQCRMWAGCSTLKQ